MSKLTQEFLDKLIKTQDALYDMYEKLDGYVTDLVRWERANLKNPCNFIDGEMIDVRVIDDELNITVLTHDSFDETICEEVRSYPLYKLLSDDWKEGALKAHQAELEKKKQKQRMEEEARAKKAEERERAEYERLKAKFEKQ